MDRNAYFQVINSDNGVGLKIFPPEGNGEVLKYEELSEYLKTAGVNEFDMRAVSQAISNTKEISSIMISPNSIYPIDETVKVIFSPDFMYAIARIYPPSSDGRRMNAFELRRTIVNTGIKYGLLEDVIRELSDNPIYCTGIVVAKGQQVIEGKNAEIVYNFQTDKKIKPKLNDDGSVDFHKLENIAHIKKGDLLAELIPEENGTSGYNVKGQEIKPKRVSKLALRYGKNIVISDDKKKLFSDLDGHATLENDTVFVSGVYEVPADVDNSTGDIEYEGNILVKGNVRTGFKLKASGSVEVSGVVEGAVIEAGGDITLRYGIQGRSKGVLKAGGNIISKFIESANVTADGFIETDTILNSEVIAKGEIHVRGKSGNLIGGRVRATNLIEATNVGSPMGSMTIVEVGIDPSIYDMVTKLKKQINDILIDLETKKQLKQVMERKLSANKSDMQLAIKLRELTKQMIMMDVQLKDLTNQYNENDSKVQENYNSKIKVNDTIYAGAKVVVSNEYKLINETFVRCQFMKIDGDVKPMSF